MGGGARGTSRRRAEAPSAVEAPRGQRGTAPGAPEHRLAEAEAALGDPGPRRGAPLRFRTRATIPGPIVMTSLAWDGASPQQRTRRGAVAMETPPRTRPPPPRGRLPAKRWDVGRTWR